MWPGSPMCGVNSGGASSDDIFNLSLTVSHFRYIGWVYGIWVVGKTQCTMVCVSYRAQGIWKNRKCQNCNNLLLLWCCAELEKHCRLFLTISGNGIVTKHTAATAPQFGAKSCLKMRISKMYLMVQQNKVSMQFWRRDTENDENLVMVHFGITRQSTKLFQFI